MAFTYDPGTDEGKVRLLISDTNEAAPIFDDAEIEAFLDMSAEHVQIAAARGLRAIAASKALQAKRVKALDIDVDTKGMSKELLDAARALEEAAEDEGAFAIAEMTVDDFTSCERRRKERQRAEL